MVPLSTRQRASAFNQPLSLDTSSVTNMDGMFEVRSAPYPQPPQSGPPSALLASPPLLHALPSPSPHVALLPCFPSTPQGTDGLSDANKLLIRCAWSGSYAFVSQYDVEWSYLGACSPPPPPPPALPPYPPDAAPRPPPSPPPYAFADTASLRTAVEAYNADAASATATYGPISSWNVSAITSMANLFSGMSNFNADISSWDTSSVTDMGSMFLVRSAPAYPHPPQAVPSCTLLAPLPPPHALAPPGPHVAPSSYASFFYLAGGACVQPAAELRHVQRHKHAQYV